jgi:hypothetical protein
MLPAIDHRTAESVRLVPAVSAAATAEINPNTIPAATKAAQTHQGTAAIHLLTQFHMVASGTR